MRTTPLLLLPLGLAACGSPDATDAEAPVGAEVLDERAGCPRSVQLHRGELFWSEHVDGVTQIFRSDVDALDPAVVWEGPSERARDFTIADDAAYWLGYDWPVRLDLETGLAAPLRASRSAHLVVVDRARVVVETATEDGDGQRIVEVRPDGGVVEIAAYPGTQAAIEAMYAGPNAVHWIERVDGVATWQIANLLEGGRSSAADPGEILAFTADAGHRYVVARDGDAARLTVDGWRELAEVPVTTTSVAPDDEGGAYVVADLDVLHVREGRRVEALDVANAVEIASEDGVVIVSRCRDGLDSWGGLVRWWPEPS